MIFNSRIGLPRKTGEYWLDAISIFFELLCANSAHNINHIWAMWVFEISVLAQVFYYLLDEAIRVRIWQMGPQVMNALQMGLPISTPDFQSIPASQAPSNFGFPGFQQAPQSSNLFVAKGKLKTLILWRSICGALTTILVLVGFVATLF